MKMVQVSIPEYLDNTIRRLIDSIHPGIPANRSVQYVLEQWGSKRMRLGVTMNALKKFAEITGVQKDWHKPDNQGVTAEIHGDHLDNAFGDVGTCGEFIVVLRQHGNLDCSVNIANLLSIAASNG